MTKIPNKMSYFDYVFAMCVRTRTLDIASVAYRKYFSHSESRIWGVETTSMTSLFSIDLYSSFNNGRLSKNKLHNTKHKLMHIKRREPVEAKGDRAEKE